MNLLFLTLISFESLQQRNLYTDLLRMFVRQGHEVFVISPVEKRFQTQTHLVHEDGATILRLQIGNIQQTNSIEKGITTVKLEPTIRKAIKRFFFDVKFDLVLYSTPPITLVSPVRYVKRRDGARTYLLLKDIFPQNAVDIGMMSTAGIRGVLYRLFRCKEKKLYAISDNIGCMSQANVDYIIAHNPEIDPKKLEVCPNSIEIIDKSVDAETRRQIRQKYGIPLDKKVFVYGGNLGKPQGVPYIIECLKKCKEIQDAFFLIVGGGTEYHLIDEYVQNSMQANLKLMQRLPHDDYDTLVAACDVGMLFLDHRFTIPNFPSRLLSYMQAKLPVIACTDPNTDVGKVVVEGGFGWWIESNDADCFRELICRCTQSIEPKLGENAFQYLCEHYAADHCAQVIQKTVDPTK